MTEKTEETVQGTGLEVPMVFDEAAAGVLAEMRKMAKTDSTEKVIKDAIRLYDWYLRTKNKNHPILVQVGQNQFHRVTFDFS